LIDATTIRAATKSPHSSKARSISVGIAATFRMVELAKLALRPCGDRLLLVPIEI
jgi:hypothetical protein